MTHPDHCYDSLWALLSVSQYQIIAMTHLNHWYAHNDIMGSLPSYQCCIPVVIAWTSCTSVPPMDVFCYCSTPAGLWSLLSHPCLSVIFWSHVYGTGSTLPAVSPATMQCVYLDMLQQEHAGIWQLAAGTQLFMETRNSRVKQWGQSDGMQGFPKINYKLDPSMNFKLDWKLEPCINTHHAHTRMLQELFKESVHLLQDIYFNWEIKTATFCIITMITVELVVMAHCQCTLCSFSSFYLTNSRTLTSCVFNFILCEDHLLLCNM